MGFFKKKRARQCLQIAYFQIFIDRQYFINFNKKGEQLFASND